MVVVHPMTPATALSTISKSSGTICGVQAGRGGNSWHVFGSDWTLPAWLRTCAVSD